ncbi:SpoIIE family protein phosphatase [Pseudanabaena sp. FACHB-1998]|uniref:SpoIIE family protein phosphatase n=1 Tax=Pseudanabaena sp. FACHB-1998 TaxID=2692858 RepID=UPI001F553D1C|nr:SpoIIE family protein phosphatase [Pseudanabaena sp. FACHB-1998]
MPRFQFKSITHRLIFGCVVAAIAIYGFSYWQGRQIIQKTVGSWLIDLAQSRIDNASHEISEKLLEIERRAILVRQSLTQEEPRISAVVTNDRLNTSLKQLLEKQPQVRAIALVNATSPKANSVSGWIYDRQSQFSTLVSDQNIWQNRCQGDRQEPFWSKPYSSNGELTGLTYCIPLTNKEPDSLQNPRQEQKNNQSYLAIDVNLDWMPTLLYQQFANSEETHYLALGSPFIMLESPDSNQPWLLKPNNPEQIQLRLTQNANTNSANRELVNTKIDTQGILITKSVDIVGLIGIAFPASKLEEYQQKYIWLMILSMSKDMLLMCVVITFISQLTTRTLRALNNSTEEMAKGNLLADLPEVTSEDEVGRLTQSFRRMRDSLQLHIKNLQETSAAKQKLESELSIAAQIQRTMLPRISGVSKPNSSYDISAILKPARIVGGDLYDFFLLGSDRLCLIIGDVADKGFPSALQMARTITLIRTLARECSTPQEILSNVNQELCADNEECLFVTVFCGILELNSGQLTYTSGGHDAPILVRNEHVHYLELETMPPLGLYDDIIFEEHKFTLLPNDLLLLYTDGITEAMNAEGEFFTDTRLLEMMASYPPSNPAKAVRTVQHFCQQFVADAPQSDDMTLLALQYLPSNPFLQVANVMQWNLTINSELTALAEVKQNLGNILQESEISVELIEDAQLIAEEVLVNIIEYGYDHRNDGHVDLRIEVDKEALKMTFTDSGKPFNPLELVPPDLDKDDDERSLGGFGFYLVQELSDQVDYAYRDEHNVLSVLTNLR